MNLFVAFLVLFFYSFSCVFANNVSTNLTNYKELCKSKKCLLKCCPVGTNVIGKFSMLGRTCVTPVSHGKNLDFSDIPLYTRSKSLTGRSLKDVYSIVPGAIMVAPFYNDSFDFSTEGHLHYLTEDSILLQLVPNQFINRYELNNTRFCVDYLLYENHTINRATFWSILERKNMFNDENRDANYNIVGLLISCVFFLIIMVIYSLLPELRTLSGMILMAFVISMFWSFLLIAIVQMGPYSPATCFGITYFAYFFLIAAFSWMTIMSYSFWSMQCKHKLIGRRSQRSANSKFKFYSIFAWGLPSILTIFMIITNHVNMRSVPWFITPNLTKQGCFIAGGEKMLYLYIPMLVLIIINWVFFLLSSCSLLREYQSTSMVDSQDRSGQKPLSHRSKKNRFLIYLKLSILMGINWVLEVLSAFHPELPIWLVTDLYNMLIGFFMFMIFIGCRYKTLYVKLRRKFSRQDSTIASTVDNI